MYYLLPLRILFLVGFFHREFIHAEINKNGELLLRDFGFDSNKLKEIGIVMNNILKNYISAPNNKLFRQRNSSSLLNLDVTLIGDTISDEIENTLRNIGLINLNKKNRQLSLRKNEGSNVMFPLTVRNSIIVEIFSFILKLLPIIEAVTSTLEYYCRKNNYRQKGYLKSNFSLPKIITQSSPYELKIVSLADNSEKYINAYLNCWNNNFTLFNASEAFINIVKYPPKITGRIVKLRLSKLTPRNPYKNDILFTEFDAITCQLLIENNSRIAFENCLKQLELVEKCIEITFNKSVRTDKLKWQSAQILKKTINNLDLNCKVEKNSTNFKINCQKNINETNNINNNQLLILIEKFVGNSFTRSAASRRVIKKLGNLLSKDKSCAESLQQIKTLIELHDMAIFQQEELLMRSKNQSHLIKECNKRSKQLYLYTRSLTEIVMNIINQIRRITRRIEEVLVKFVSTSMGINLSNNLRSMRCLDKIFHKIGMHFLNKFNFTSSRNKTGRQIWGVERVMEKKDNRELAIRSKVPVNDLSVYFNNDWLKIMRSLSQTNTRRNPNTITTLANVFLLATLFYEFIFIFAEAIYRREREPDIYSQPMIPPNFGFPDDVHGPPFNNDPDPQLDELTEYSDSYQ